MAARVLAAAALLGSVGALRLDADRVGTFRRLLRGAPGAPSARITADLAALGLAPPMLPVIGPFLHSRLGDAGDVLNIVLPVVLLTQAGKILDLGKKSATASHILVTADKYEKLLEVKAEVEAGKLAFDDAARQYSKCPSGKNGGSLGEFKSGKMVPEFDRAVFDEAVPLGELQLVRTSFGWHLIKVEARGA